MAERSWRQYGAGIACGAAVTAGLIAWGPGREAAAVPNIKDAQEVTAVFRHVAADVMPSIVSISTVTRPRRVEMSQAPFENENSPFFEMFRNDPRFRDMLERPRRQMSPRRQGAGSGFIIDASGVIMTNNHVVEGADEVRVRLHDGREFLATDIKTDPRTDVAIVRIQDAGNLKPLKLGDSRAMQVGDWVLAFGSPFGLDMTVTQGIISGTSRHRGLAEREDFLQTDAAINPGNSGGPLVNIKGEVIGINTAIASASGGYDGIGFAIPTHIARWVGDQLVSNGAVKRGYLGTGIARIDTDTAKQFNVKVGEGVVVRSVMPNSPAEDAGLEPGDVVLKLDGQPVNDPSSLQGVVEQLTIGSPYKVDIVRGGKPQTLSVTIKEMPENFTARATRTPDEEPAPESHNALGMTLDTLTPNLAKQLGVSTSKGVVVTDVEAESAAGRAGVRVGDVVERVGETSVATVDEFDAAVKELSLKDGVVLHLRNANGKHYVILKAQDEEE